MYGVTIRSAEQDIIRDPLTWNDAKKNARELLIIASRKVTRVTGVVSRK
jgi:hypothetical protein